MANKQECDSYAAELARRFEEFTGWAIANWPKKDFPLLLSDFDQSRRELGNILGPKLAEGDESDGPSAGNAEQGQYIDVNPMPWP